MSSPHITYPPELPVSAAKDEIADAIRNHQVVIVAGATGSGKTTQLPKICWELGRTKIAHTQPRRLAARTIAERISEELGVELGTSVGYKVRFTDKVSDDTVIALMTDGILLNEIHRDRLLRRYDTIIIDEAHERSLNVDFLMGYLVRILPERPDLKIIITSATIDPQSFARHFSIGGIPAPVIEVSGRTFPVEIRYHEPSDDGDEVDAIVAALRELDAEPRGDVLVFLPGEAEIRDAMDALRGEFTSTTSRTEVLPLFGRLSAADQHRVFERSSVAGLHRRIILATNVAETSLTVPGIKYVVDTGTARISRYSVRSKVQRLPIEPISQASAQQRAGRAGRTSDGIAIRLFAEDDFDKRLAYTEPEILRTNLASVVLQMLALGFGDIEDFPFLTPPDSRGVKAALDLLGELGAVKGDGKRLTTIGTQLARLPIEPRFARMLIEAGRTGVSREVIAIVAGMTIQDVRERPEERREEADRLHSRFTDPTSDFLSLYALWVYLETKRDELGSSAFRRMCRDEMLNYVRVREWFDVHRQLERLMKDATRGERDNKAKNVARKPKAAVVAKALAGDGSVAESGAGSSAGSVAGSLVTGAADPDAVHRAILAGLLSQIGVLDTRNAALARTAKPVRPVSTYLGSRGVRFAIFPGSGLRKKAPAAVMAGELVETSRLYARSVAAIDTAWAESLAGDLAHRSISEPHWSKASGAALAYEKVTLFGVEIVAKRRIHFSRIDPAGARELFVRHALVEGEWDATRLAQNLTAFVRQNHELRKRLEKQEERERRRDILVGDEAVFDFYNSRIPHDVADVRTFEAWWKATIAHTPKLLTMRAEDLLEGSARAGAHEFPSHWAQGDLTLALAYRFEPGAKDDGVTVVIPLPLLASVEAAGFDWQVPGMRDELITAILRSFPKAIRRHVVPAADWATKFATALSASGPEHHGGRAPATLGEELARLIQPIANQRVSAADIEWDRVASHVRINYRAVDTRGRAVDSDRDLSALQARLSTQARASVADQIQRARPAASEAGAPASRFAERTEITGWDLGTLPAHVDTALAGGTVRGYPGLVDDKTSVSVRVQTDPAVAERLHRAGVRRLLMLNLPSPASYVQDHLTSAEKLSLAASPYPSVKALIEDARAAVIDQVIASSTTAPIRTEADFIAVRDLASSAMVDATFQAVSLTARILDGHRAAERIMKKVTAMPLLGALADVRGQLAGLVYSGFISSTGLARLAHFPRYLAAIAHRLENLPSNAGRDRAWMTEWERAGKLFADAKGTVPVEADARAGLVHARWLLEELRVSLYAQQLGTAEAVSIQRISKALAS